MRCVWCVAFSPVFCLGVVLPFLFGVFRFLGFPFFGFRFFFAFCFFVGFFFFFAFASSFVVGVWRWCDGVAKTCTL